MVGAKFFVLFFAFALPSSDLIWHNPVLCVVNCQDNLTRWQGKCNKTPQGILSITGILGYKWVPARIGYFSQNKIFSDNTKSQLKIEIIGIHLIPSSVFPGQPHHMFTVCVKDHGLHSRKYRYANFYELFKLARFQIRKIFLKNKARISNYSLGYTRASSRTW